MTFRSVRIVSTLGVIVFGAICSLQVFAQSTGQQARLVTAADGSGHVLIKSHNVADNYLTIRYQPEMQCQPVMAIADFYRGAEGETLTTAWRGLVDQPRSSGLVISTPDQLLEARESVLRFNYESSGDNFHGLLLVSFAASERLLETVQHYPEINIRFQDIDGEWKGTLGYEMAGIGEPAAAAREHCRRGMGYRPEWVSF